jgi:sugar lactone lactonase YvrE
MPAYDTRLTLPYGVAANSSGFYIADTTNQRVRRVDPSGIISTLAGTGTTGYSGNGGAATAAQLAYPKGTAADGKGNVYVADSSNYVIRRIDPAGIITVVAGSGVGGDSGDGGQATLARLMLPSGVSVDSSGNLYIADTNNERVRKVNPNGVITTVAGNGTGGYSGDGGPATAAELLMPMKVVPDAAGNLFIADSGNHRIRKVSPAGVITTVAGNGKAGDSGDGGLAVNAQLNQPDGVAVDVAGNLFIADTHNHRVRRVGTDGVIHPLAGTGSRGYSGDTGPASAAELYDPEDAAIDPNGNLLIVDSGNSAIRLVFRNW